MNRKQRRMAQKRGVAVPKDPVYNIKRSDINSMKEQAVSDAADAAMVLLLALPIKVLRDEYGWGTKKRLPEFADKLTEEYQKFADGDVSLEEYANLVMVQMSKSEKDRMSKAQDIALDEGGLDYVIDVAPTPDFVEVVGRKGGDVVTYRVMNDGQFYER